jgi:predicted permease
MIDGYTPIQLATIAFGLGSALVGLLIGYQAYRGFRRHDDRSMQFLSLGLVLLTAVSFSVAFFGTLLIRADVLSSNVGSPLTLLVRFAQFAGLVCIAYSLYSR